MRNFFVLVIVGLISQIIYAQDHVPTQQEFDSFFKTRTLVVMDPNPMSDFNFKIKEVMNKVWDLTEFDFISYKEFEDKRKDPSYSFLLTTVVTFDSDKTKARYNFLSLLLGQNVYDVGDLPDLCSIPLSYLRVEDDSYAYKMEAFVRFIQDHVKLVKNNSSLLKKNPLTYYNKNISSLKGKTLYLVSDDLATEINSIAKIKKVYPYNFKIVTKEEVTKVIESKDSNAVFLHKVGPEGTKYNARCYKVVVGAADSKFYYFDYHMISKKNRDALLLSDLKKMGSK
ncbi:MAG: hypothetical protein JW717_10645 [Marinilabiliaceae bacterium]|nr:hypothetical protein [Marinilabiliaceae bacterium]